MARFLLLPAQRVAEVLLLRLFPVCLILFPYSVGTTAAFAERGPDAIRQNDSHRIVSLAPGVTEIIFALGRGDRLVGVTTECDYPEEVRSLPKVGSFMRSDPELVATLKPDLCITMGDGRPGGNSEYLAGLGIPVHIVRQGGLYSISGMILELGKLLDAEERAEDLAAAMRSRIETVKARVAETTNRPRVFMQIGVSPIVSAGTETFIHELITAAGGVNVAEGPTLYPRFSREQVLNFGPDIVIITSMARGEMFQHVKEEWMQWKNLPAARNGHIFIVDSNLFDRPTPRLADGLEMLSRIIHPELYPESAPTATLSSGVMPVPFQR